MKTSVALCTYNGEAFLNEQLSSILSQSMPVDEIVIVDDRSDDHTNEILNNFREKHPEVIKLFKNEKQVGVIKNFENAITLCSGDWIFLSDQDDIWKNNKVEEMIKFANTRQGALLIYSDAALIDNNGEYKQVNLWEQIGFNKKQKKKWQNNGYAFSKLAAGDNRITGATSLMSAQLKQLAIPFLQLPEGYLHDAYLAIMAASRNGLYLLDSALTEYRIHPKQQIGIGNGVMKSKIKNRTNGTVLNSFFKSLSKKASLKFRLLLIVVKYKMTLFNLYGNLPDTNPVKQLYKMIFR